MIYNNIPVKSELLKIANDTNSFLKNFINKQDKTFLLNAIKYGLFSGGKKIRSKILVDVGKIFKIDLFLSFLSISLIFICAIAPYLLVNKSADLFYFGDYASRHSMLVSVSFSLFFTVLLYFIFY